MLTAKQIAGFFKMLYLKKEVNDEVYFWHADKHRSLLLVDTSNWGFVTRHAQSTQNKFAYLQYLQKSVDDDVDFLPADKHESFPQVDSITLGVRSQACTKYPKQQVYNIFAISQRRREG